MDLAKGEAVSAARVQNEIREFLSIFDNKYPDAPSMFEPIALLREARRQKGAWYGPVVATPALLALLRKKYGLLKPMSRQPMPPRKKRVRPLP